MLDKVDLNYVESVPDFYKQTIKLLYENAPREEIEINSFVEAMMYFNKMGLVGRTPGDNYSSLTVRDHSMVLTLPFYQQIIFNMFKDKLPPEIIGKYALLLIENDAINHGIIRYDVKSNNN